MSRGYAGAGISFEVASNASGTAVQDAVSGDAFTVKREISLDRSKRWRLLPIRAEVPNTVPNIDATKGNKFVYASTVDAPTGTQTLTLPDGRYDTASLEAEISLQMVALGHGTISTPIFVFGGSEATNIQTVKITAAGYSIDFDATGAISDLTGFSGTVGPTVAPPEVFSAAAKANYDQGLTAMLVTCSLVADAFGPNGERASSLFRASPSQGSLNRNVVVENYARETRGLIATEFSEFTIALTDQAGNPISVNGATYAASFAIVPE